METATGIEPFVIKYKKYFFVLSASPCTLKNIIRFLLQTLHFSHRINPFSFASKTNLKILETRSEVKHFGAKMANTRIKCIQVNTGKWGIWYPLIIEKLRLKNIFETRGKNQNIRTHIRGNENGIASPQGLTNKRQRKHESLCFR